MTYFFCFLLRGKWHEVPIGDKSVSLPQTRQSPGRVVFRKVYSLSLWSWDISLTLNMTLSLRGSKATAAISREGGFPQSIFFIALVVGYFACAQYDIVIAREQSDRGNPSE